VISRLGFIGFCLLLLTSNASASSCAGLKSQPGAWVAANVDALTRAARAAYESDKALPAYERLLDGIATKLQRCKLSQDKDFSNRYRAFVEYVETASLDRQPDHELGFNVTDQQYLAETGQYVKIPEFLMDQSFLRSVSRYETLPQAKSFLRRLNSERQASEQLIFFSYKSRHLGTPDNRKCYGRLLIVVPGNPRTGVPERWVQFGVPDPRARTRVRNVSVVAAMLGSNGTFNSYFKDFYRTYHIDGSISIDGRWELGEGNDNCASCHKSGILPIFPVAGSVNRDEQQSLVAVNQRFLTYGSPRFDKYLDATKFGPGLGSAAWNDRKQRFGAVFEGTSPARSMSCAGCHQPVGLGALNWPMDRIVISSFVKGGQMPWGYKLNVIDRRKLYGKLIQQYFGTDKDDPGILKSWLLTGSSETSLSVPQISLKRHKFAGWEGRFTRSRFVAIQP
jgi:hypothetical protein